jgi:hypothetical protein
MEQVRIDFHATPLAADDPRFMAALDLQIAQMRRVLDLMAPQASQDAFRSLHEMVPEALFDEPVRYAAGGQS